MPADDIADDSSFIFTEADVYLICGYLAAKWEIEDDVTEDTEEAIMNVLKSQNAS